MGAYHGYEGFKAFSHAKTIFPQTKRFEVAKLGDADGANAVDLINAGEVKLVVNSPRGRGPRADGDHIRSAAGRASVPLLTTGAAALAAAKGMQDWQAHELAVRSLQEYHQGVSVDALEPAGGSAAGRSEGDS